MLHTTSFVKAFESYRQTDRHDRNYIYRGWSETYTNSVSDPNSKPMSVASSFLRTSRVARETAGGTSRVKMSGLRLPDRRKRPD